MTNFKRTSSISSSLHVRVERVREGDGLDILSINCTSRMSNVKRRILDVIQAADSGGAVSRRWMIERASKSNWRARELDTQAGDSQSGPFHQH